MNDKFKTKFNMKKILIAICVISIFAITACKKENVGDANNAQQIQSKRIEALILDFKDKLENHLKDGTAYAADSATWYVEGLLNYEQAYNTHNFSGLEFYYDSVLLNSTNGEIPIQELNDAYSYFNGVIATILQQANDPLLNVDLIDVSFAETGLKDGSVEMEMMVSTGRGTPINYTLFGENEYWYWGWNLGACYINPSPLQTGASNLLEYKFNHPLSVGQSGWFTNVVYEEVNGDTYEVFYDPNNPGPYCYSMIFFYAPLSPPPDYPCLSPDELNYYLSKFDFIKGYVQQNTPGLSGKTFKNVEVIDDMVIGIPGSCLHWYKLFYGTLNENPH